MKALTLFINLLFGFSACILSQSENQVLFEKKNNKSIGVNFRNSLMENDSANMLSFTNFYEGCGVGIIDVNNDGMQDIFIGGNMVTSRLFLNRGGWKFQDITKKSGVKTDRWITGISIVDINQDGFDDIYLSVSGSLLAIHTENLLFVNNGDNTFSEKAAAYNLNIKAQSTQTSFFDYDRDGDLDAFIATNPTDFKLNSTEAINGPKVNGESAGTDKLFRNDGNGKFTEVSRKAGILKEGYSLGVNTSDFNQDGWTDIFVTNDYYTSDILYINNGDGTFTDKVDKYFGYSSFASMGNDAGDIDNDGLIDVVSLDMAPESSYRQKLIVGTLSYDSFNNLVGLGYMPQYSRNLLLLNNGNNTFSEIGRLAGISRSDWSWASVLIDLDNDADKDLFITTGFRRDMGNMDFIYKTNDSPFKRGGNPVPIPLQLEAIKRYDGIPVNNYAFTNNNNLSFTNVSKEWGFDEKSFSSGVAAADLDNDGDPDLIINRVDDDVAVYENKTERLNNHFLNIRLQGSEQNKSGIGAKIKLYYNGNLQYIENNPFRGYLSSFDKNILFGLGSQKHLDSVEVIWPDGLCSIRHNVTVDTTIIMQYHNDLSRISKNKALTDNSLKFKEITQKLGIGYKHKEYHYIDFYNQPLLPHQHSQLGPSVAVGDINGDGLEDFFIGGAREYPGTIYFQNSDCTFQSVNFPFDKEYEDMGALLFDFDADNDLDLYVASGGTSAGKNIELYQDRLYRNTGNGKFEKTEYILPAEFSSGSVVTAADFDRDLDLDLFVGGRISPGNYPDAPRSYLLENRNGRFIDITNEKASGLSFIGMVTSAIWSDFTGDGDIDLILTGEWMPITIYENVNGALQNMTKDYGLENSTGWWNSINSGDFNNDGQIDYVLGNLGLNNPYFASQSEPLKLVSKDFDFNGKQEPILIMKYPDGYFPVASRSQYLSSFPAKARKYDTYEAYARTNADELLNDLGKDKTRNLEAKFLANALLFHLSDSTTDLKPLPAKGQFSPVFGSQVADIDGNKESDILIVGNFFSSNVNDGPYNAFTGGLVFFDPVKGIDISSGHENGFYVHTDARALASLVLGNQERIYLVTSNNDSLKAFSPVINRERHIRLQPMDSFAIIEMDNGIHNKQEFYYGSGYLSQSSRYLSLTGGWKKADIFTYSGQQRTIIADVSDNGN